MAHIKCRYSVPLCILDARFEECYNEEACRDYTPKNPKVIYSGCEFKIYKHGEFEKTVRRYEYYDGLLEIGKEEWTEDDIDYLEIDGRVLVSDKEGK